MMNCEEFELRGLDDMDRVDASPADVEAAAKHAEACTNCAALLESWREVKGDLRLLREATRQDGAPARVEMRLKQELRTRREARVPRSTVVVAGWALAAAAVLVASIGWVRTRERSVTPGAVETGTEAAVTATNGSTGNDEAMLLAADYDSGEFTQLPGNLQGRSDEAAVLQVRLQRGALVRFGLPVEQERAADWVNVDFLVGEDGQPQAVRLHQEPDVMVVTQ